MGRRRLCTGKELRNGQVKPKTSELSEHFLQETLLGGSWVVVSRVRSKITIVIAHISGLRTPLITTHEPPSKPDGL